MGKKRSHPGVVAEQPSSALSAPPPTDTQQHKPHNEIDEIFAKRKKAKTPNVRLSNPAESSEPRENFSRDEKDVISSSDVKKKNKSKKKGNAWPEPPPKPRRKTNDGHNIYSAEELGFNKREAGGTPLCPFDCECCF